MSDQEERDHPAWPDWLICSGHIEGTTMGYNSGWLWFKAGWDYARSHDFNIATDALNDQTLRPSKPL